MPLGIVMSAPGVVFVMYHELESPGRPLCQTDPGYVRYAIRASDFQAQLELLQREGWKGMSIGEVVSSFPPKTVAITFDDGSESDLLAAAPILRQCAFGATFFITAGWLGRPGFLSPSQLRELSALGFEIGSHSMTHACLTDLDDAGLRRELVDSKLQLEQIIGKPVEHFSCPGGRFDARVARMACDAGYRTLTTSQPRANTMAADRFSLGRVAIMRHCSLPEFRELCLKQKLLRSRLGLHIRDTARQVLGNSNYERLRAGLLHLSRLGRSRKDRGV